MSIKDRLFIASQYVLPQHLLSRAVGTLADAEMEWVKNPLIDLFIKQFGVNMSEAHRQSVAELRSCLHQTD